MLGHYYKGGKRIINYEEINKKLTELLIEFGPFRKSFHPEFPFWYLQNDGFWELKNAENLVIRKGNSNPLKSELVKYNIQGGFTAEIYKQLKNDHSLLLKVANSILIAHFPWSYHDDILEAVGLNPETEAYSKRKRNPDFRELILRAYRYRCAVCGFDVKLGREPVALEAAHIKWHQAGGPDEEPNGLALCTLHHKLFDRGAFTLSEMMVIKVSEYAHGGKGMRTGC